MTAPTRLLLDAPSHLRSAPPIAWALERLGAAIGSNPGAVRFELRDAGASPLGSGPTCPDLPESYAFAVAADDDGLLVRIVARDERGFAYALNEVTDRFHAGTGLADGDAEAASPHTPVRGIQRMFSSAHEDFPWFHDRAFWTEYLDHLATQRFNRFQLGFGMQYNFGTGSESRTATDNYLCFAYPFLIDVPGYRVRAQGVDAAERDRNFAALAWIAHETRRRGMTFQLGLWNHAYDFGYDSPHWYPVLGVSDDNHAAYSAAALKILLERIPEIDGLTFRVHHEGGIPDEGHEAFWGTLFQAASEVGRPLEIDMHAKGVDDALLEAARKPNLRTTISAKYWAEHMGLPYHQASIRQLERQPLSFPGMDTALTGVTDGARRFTRYGYADYLREDRDVDVIFRVWPGTQKLLLWGDPAFAAGYGRLSTIGGARGVEYCEPLFFKGRRGTGRPGGREPYVRDDLRSGTADWRKYRYTYLLWGRLAYDPDAAPEVWQRFLRAEYGESADAFEAALASLSRILPLVTVVHGVSGANNFYWPEMYVDLAISLWKQSMHYAFDTPAPRTWEGVSPFDPTLFAGVGEYVDEVLSGRLGPKHTPLEVARWLEEMVENGTSALDRALETSDPDDPQTARTVIDLRILAELGTFFANKFRSAVDYTLYRRSGDTEHLRSAIERLGAAHAAYARIPNLARGVYQNELDFGSGISERGSWSDRIPAMREDAFLLRLELEQAGSSAPALTIEHRERRPRPATTIDAPERFTRGRAFPVSLLTDDSSVVAATLVHRPLDQSADYARVPMTRTAQGFVADVAATATDTGFPLIVFVEVELDGDAPVFVPALDDDLANQPYLVIGSTDSPW